MKYRKLLVWSIIWMAGMIVAGSGLWPSVAAQTTGNITSRVSIGGGVQGNGRSNTPSISADGRFVAFSSEAANLVPNDTNKKADIFVYDRETEQTSRVSVGSKGEEGNGHSFSPSISADGNLVAFASDADNLVANDTNGPCGVCGTDVFVYDRQAKQISRVSVGPNGLQGNRYSEHPAISADGNFVAFSSWADNLVSNDTNYQADIFVYDRQKGQTSRVSVGPNGTQSKDGSAHPSISADGSFVAFESWARNLVPNDTNDWLDVFVHNRKTGQTSRVSVNSNGNQGNKISFAPSISADGRYVAFGSESDNLVPNDNNKVKDVFVHDRETGKTIRASVDSNGGQAYNWSGGAVISPDGRFVAFESWADQLVPGDTNGRGDVFIRDWQGGVTARVSIGTGGGQGDEWSHHAAISRGGLFVAFESEATNLVPNDTNLVADVFVHARTEPVPPTMTPGTPTTPTVAPTTTPDPARIVLFLPVYFDN